MSDLQEYITLIILGSEDVFKEFKEKINSISRIDNTVNKFLREIYSIRLSIDNSAFNEYHKNKSNELYEHE